MTVLNLSDDPSYRRRIVAQLYGDNGAEWRRMAACADIPEQFDPDEWHKSFFKDEVGNVPELEFPETAARRMRICFGCPVRAECLADAYEHEQSWEPIPGTAPVRYHWVEDSTRFGIRGGVPGRIRERFARHPRRLEACEEWVQDIARKRRWGLEEVVARLWNRDLAPPPSMADNA